MNPVTRNPLIPTFDVNTDVTNPLCSRTKASSSGDVVRRHRASAALAAVLLLSIAGFSDAFAKSLGEQADVDFARREPEEAGALYREAYPQVAMARLELDYGRAETAEEMLRHALTLLAASHAPEHWRIADAESLLGASLSAQGRFEEAEELLRRSYVALQTQLSARAPRTREALSRLADFYRSRGPEGPLSARPETVEEPPGAHVLERDLDTDSEEVSVVQ